MQSIDAALSDLANNPNLFAEVSFGKSLPAKMRFAGQLEHLANGTYRFIAEASGIEMVVQADGAWNVTVDAGTVTISKEAGTLSKYVAIGPRF